MSIPPNERLVTTTRDLDAALDRWDRRQSEQPAILPPDFLHGDTPLEALHRVYGEAWAEGVAFVQHHRDGRVSFAAFDDWFLTVEHSSTHVPRPDDWLAERIAECHTVVELHLDASFLPETRNTRWIDLHCSIERLQELERTHLSVVRDGANDWRTVAQTNLLSLVTLCATFGDWRTLLH